MSDQQMAEMVEVLVAELGQHPDSPSGKVRWLTDARRAGLIKNGELRELKSFLTR